MAHSRSRHLVAALAGLLSAAAALSGVGALGSVAAAATPALTLSPSQPLTNETVALKGVLGPTSRPLVLQKYAGGRWVSVTSARAGSGGAYAFKVKATGTSASYRVSAAGWKFKRHRYAAVSTRTTAVRGTTGSGLLTVLSYPMGNDTGVHLPVVARFTPARPGKLVRLLDAQGATVAAATQSTDGTATMSVPAGAAGSAADYHAMTFPGNGATNYATPTVTATTTSATQTFDDEFSGSSLDTAKWGLRAEGYYGNRTCSKPSADQVSVGSGYVTLGVQRVAGATSTVLTNGSTASCKYGVWKNGVISTLRGSSPFHQTYGVFAARVRMQAPMGMHSSFWLQGAGGPGSSEVDVFEHFGLPSPHGLTTKIHRLDGTTVTSVTSTNLIGALRGRSATSDNVLSVEWSPSLYVFRINGIETFRTTRQISSSPSELVLSLMTSDWELSKLDPRQNFTTSTAKMHVDWVRAWG